MDNNRTNPVLVVGAGPVGLLLAGELARRAVPVRIIDALPAPTTQSRAVVLHARTLEMLERIGLVDAVIAAGEQATAMEMRASGRLLARVNFDEVDSAYPFTVVLPQTETERLLREHLTAQGVEVERNVRLVALDQDAGAAHATLRHPDGRDEVTDTPWLVGTDGAGSTARQLAGSRLDGVFDGGERFLMGDVDADHDLDARSMYTFFSAHQPPLLVFLLRGGRMRVIAQIAADDDRTATLEWLQQVTDERAGGIGMRAAHWLTTFDVHHAQVPSYRIGRVLLAGDAAHIHSPAGGQGMNTGLQDAFNLGWKLATGNPALLDSYHTERHPVAAEVIEFSTRLTRIGTLASPLARVLRNEVLHAAADLASVRHALANQVEEITVAYRASPVVLPSGPRRGPHAGDAMPHVSGTTLPQTLTKHGRDHVLLTVAAGRSPGPAGGMTQILVNRDGTPAAGYAATVADPLRLVAQRLNLPDGGRVAVRPDGYIAAIADLTDPTMPTRYQQLITDEP